MSEPLTQPMRVLFLCTHNSSLQAAGFVDIQIEVIRRYSLDDIKNDSTGTSLMALSADEYRAVDGKFVSAFVSARKPGA